MSKPERPIFTYQTRLPLAPGQAAVLDAYAEIHGRAERTLFAALQAGGKVVDLKRAFLPRFGITARQFNAIRVGLEGKVASIQERRPELIAEAQSRIRKARKVITQIETRLATLRDPVAAFKSGRTVKTLSPEQRRTDLAKAANKLHQKKRRLANHEHRLKSMQADHAAGTVRLCFGSRTLFRAQFDLAANGYASLDDWRKDWKGARSNQFFVLGSKDESAGNQTCQAKLVDDGSLSLILRLPDALAPHGKTLVIPGIRFAYGHEALIAALGASRKIEAQTKAGKPTVKLTGTALSYRFLRDDQGWRVFASVEAPAVPVETHPMLGAFGVDTNADHLALAETDRYGNLVSTHRIPLPVYGKSTDQAKALIGDAAVRIAGLAKDAGKPVVIEALNFQKKKTELETADPRQARMLSSFTCSKVSSSIKAACFRAGVEVIEVNPAYTSVIGAVNHARVKGISVHLGAAYAIARRGLALAERPTVQTGLVPARNGGHVTFSLPVRNREKHEWFWWSKVRTHVKAAHVAHYRSGRYKEMPAPLSPAMRTLSASRFSTARFRGANRAQYCSERVLDDVPV